MLEKRSSACVRFILLCVLLLGAARCIGAVADTREKPKADSIKTNKPAGKNAGHSAIPSTMRGRVSGVGTSAAADSFSFLDDYPALPAAHADSHVVALKKNPDAARHARVRAPFFKQATVKFVILLLSLFIIFETVVFYRNRRRNNQNFMKQTRLSIMDKEVRRACKYIENSYADNRLDPEFICRELVTSVPFLEALFERELGMSIAGFLAQVRIHHVRRLRETVPSMGCAELAAQTGFSGAAALQETYSFVTGSALEEK